MENNEFSELVAQASQILEVAENYQWEIGRLSNEVVETYGYKALEDFSKQIQEQTGVKRSAGTLRMYAYVWKISNKLGLPKDILFSGCQSIIFSKDPPKYAAMARQGLSGTDIRKAIYNDKYAPQD